VTDRRWRLFLYGYYGRRNSGDDAMLYAFLNAAVSANRDIEFRILRGEDAPEVPGNATGSTRFVSSTIPAVLRSLLGADGFAIVGGTHLTDYGLNRRTAGMIGRIALLVGLSRLLGKKVYFFGTGLGPFRRMIPKAVARLTCMQADAIIVRDHASYEVAKSLGVAEKTRIGFDVAALAGWRPEGSAGTRARARRTLGISITPVFTMYHDDEASDQVLANRVGEAVNTWMRTHPEWRVELFVFHGRSNLTDDDDAHITEQLRQILAPRERVSIVDYNSNPTVIFRSVSQCAAFVAMKYHACLFAYLNDIPLLIIPYHPKCADLAKEIRLPEAALVPLEAVFGGELGRHIESLTSAGADMKAALPVQVSEARARAAIEVLAEVNDE